MRLSACLTNDPATGKASLAERLPMNGAPKFAQAPSCRARRNLLRLSIRRGGSFADVQARQAGKKRSDIDD
jgi:hypothetical protein